jgi:hypothetical protein
LCIDWSLTKLANTLLGGVVPPKRRINVQLTAAPKNKSLLRGEVSGLLEANNLRSL